MRNLYLEALFSMYVDLISRCDWYSVFYVVLYNSTPKDICTILRHCNHEPISTLYIHIHWGINASVYILVFYFCCVLSLAGQCCLLIASATLNRIYLISHHKPYICIMHSACRSKWQTGQNTYYLLIIMTYFYQNFSWWSDSGNDTVYKTLFYDTLQWRHNVCDCVSNHQPRDCLLSRLFRRRSKETSKLRITGLCGWNSPMTGEFPAQRASNAENVSIRWRHHETISLIVDTQSVSALNLAWLSPIS